jgi:acyl-CoA synthetase (AMP-forming)/AMP-acid ligase II/acyl carrier protein
MSFVPFFEVARAVAAERPDELLYAWADDRGEIVERVSRRVAMARVAAIAEDLRRRFKPGERVLLVYPPGLAFAWALLGCMAAGLVAVPAYPPNPAKGTEDIERLVRIARDAQCRLALTDRSFRWVVRWLEVKGLLLGTRMPDLAWTVTGSAESRAPLVVAPVEADDVAVLQYTSGSTGDPRGVAITYGNLDHQLSLNRSHLGMHAGSRFVAWVPQYHDLGLISGILSTAWGNGSLTLTSPVTFLRRPSVWFDLATEVRATHTAAPNFAFGLVLRRSTKEERARWRLDALELVMSAAEPIDPALMARFFDEMAPTGLRPETFCPAYGLAEHTVGVTLRGRARVECDRDELERDGVVRPARGKARRATLVGCGAPPAGVDVRIVQPDARVALPVGRVGEIWVRSPSVAAGYHGRPDETAETFHARLEGADGTWLRTGDLGAICEGELVVTGRLKDLIICGGRNLYPQDVELTVAAAHAAVRPGCVAAFAVPGTDTDGLGIAVELRDGAEPASVVAAIQRAVRQHHGLGVDALALGRSGLVHKTTSGKVRRQSTARALLDGSLERSPAFLAIARHEDSGTHDDAPDDRLVAAIRALPKTPSSERYASMVDALCAAAAEACGRERLAADRSFQEQGLESLAAVEFVARIEGAIGKRLPVEQLALNPTPARLAERLLEMLGLDFEAPRRDARREVIERPPWPVHRRPTPSRSRVAIVGGGVAGLTAAHELARLGYRDVTIFESEPAVGGKVTSVVVDGIPCELGGTFFSEASRLLLDLARELDLSFSPAFGTSQLAREQGLAEPDAPTVTDRWLDRVFEAAGGPVADEWIAGFGHRDPSLAQPMASWLRAHQADRIPFDISMLWTAYGYGYIDDEVPAHLLVEYKRHARHRSRTPVRIDGGNQRLWQTLAARLEERGMRVRTATPVTRVTPTDEGAWVEAAGARERFDEVIFACEPAIAARTLPDDDVLGRRLQRFRTIPYLVHILRVANLPPGVAAITTERGFSRAQSGHVLGLIRQDPSADLVSISQYAIDARGERIPDDELARLLEADLASMGLALVERCATRLWSYFPAVGPEHAGTWLEVQALQGDRGLWVVGGSVSFEAMEHTARHARTLARLGFGEGASTLDDLVAEAPPSTVVGAGPAVPAPLGAQWALDFLTSGRSQHNAHVGAILAIEGCDEARVRDALGHLEATLEGLRVRYRLVPDGPLAYVSEVSPVDLETRVVEGRDELRAWARALLERPFTPDDARLYRAGLASLEGGRALVLVSHHAITDADGFGAIVVQLARTLGATSLRREPTERASVLDEALAAELSRAGALPDALSYWQRRLSTMRGAFDTRTVGPLVSHLAPIDRSVSRRMQLAEGRTGRPIVAFLAAAAARVAKKRAAGDCLGLVTAHRFGEHFGPRPSRLTILPLSMESLPEDPAGHLLGTLERVEQALEHLVDGPTLGELMREARFEASPWAWTVNHFELPRALRFEGGRMDIELLTSDLTRRPLELATVLDPGSGAMTLRLHARAPDFDATTLAEVAHELHHELATLVEPTTLWKLPGIGILG